MSEGFREAMAQARITLVLDGVRVLENSLVGNYLGMFSDPPPERSPFNFASRHGVLFTAHRKGMGSVWDRPPVGYFLPRGTIIDATLKDTPEVPPGVVVRVAGAGYHYSPDAIKCASEGTCRTE